MTQKNLYIKTYGCQMNVYDSLKIGDLLKPFGYALSDTLGNADMVVLNTCHIREKATEKVYSELGRIKKQFNKNKKEGVITVVAGCVAQAQGEEIFARVPWVNIVVGPQSYHDLPELLARVARTNKKAINLSFVEHVKFDNLPESSESQGASAFISIQEGCDKFCKFCCVPYTRGAEFSRTFEQIYREALLLSFQGSKEIVLLGQNVNAYHGLNNKGEPITLARLIEQLSKIEAIERIRYTTSHPVDMTDDLIAMHGTVEKLVPFLHLPVQSGSDKILKEMNRKHDVAFYLNRIESLQKTRAGIYFSSDFIVGYPGETEEDFQLTLDLVKKVQFTQGYSYKYSPRPGTPASILPQIDESIKEERLSRLQELLLTQQRKFNESFSGKTLSVLLEKPGKHANQVTGRSQYSQSVCVEDADKYIGKIVDVKINKITNNGLVGALTSKLILREE